MSARLPERGVIDPILGWLPSQPHWAPSLRYVLRRDRVMEALRKAEHHGGRLLEIGCGAGSLLIELCDMGYSCVGLESSPAALSASRRSISESGRSVKVEAIAEPGWKQGFNMLLALEVLEHIEDDRLALDNWSEWLAPGGQMVLSVPAHRSKWGPGDVWAGHFRRYEKNELIAKVQATGLEVVDVECYGFPMGNLTEFLGRWYYRKELARRNSTGEPGDGVGNALSGVDRRAYQRLMPLIQSAPSRLLIKTACWMQRSMRNTDLGNGYLVRARKA